ncbi:MAG TPA: aminoglycoside 3-N-acetyltransferase [Bryobacteraceae bacterium]|nr:aminoglycoside 3-N-acetyltransferase [Bryobacteraceae bacterium]
MRATRASLTADLTRLGVRLGDAVMVHSSLRAVGPVLGGAAVVVQALLDAVGTDGTLVAYVDLELFHEEDDIDDVPVFDKQTAPAARDHGVLHATIRTWPGAIRSDHPDAGVVAIGARAEWLTADHPFQYGYGEGSPFEKFVECGGRVLMLGAPLDTITLLHHAEHKARLPQKRIRRYRRLMPGPKGPQWTEFEEFDTANPVVDTLPSDCFGLIAKDYLATGRAGSGQVGNAPSYLFDGRELVAFAVEWLEARCRNGRRHSFSLGKERVP